MYFLLKFFSFLFFFGSLNTLQAGEPLKLYIKVKQPSCAGKCDGKVYLTVTGGQPGYKYLWSHGLRKEDYRDACAGTGAVTVTDFEGNKATATYEVVDPAPISIEKMQTIQPTAGQSDGSIEIDVSGGLLPYQFSLDGEKFSASNNFYCLAPGQYIINIKDTNGCLLQSETKLLNTPKENLELETAYHLTYNAETWIIHLYSGNAITMELTDMLGRKLQVGEINKDQNISLDELDYGVYFLKLSDDVRRSYEKIIKVKS